MEVSLLILKIYGGSSCSDFRLEHVLGGVGMHALLGIGFIITILYFFMQFARQEYIQDEYEETIGDVEGRLEWARSRSVYPFGMKAQVEVSGELLAKAKSLWRWNKWHQAYNLAMQSQKAMDRAQSIYSSSLKKNTKNEVPQ